MAEPKREIEARYGKTKEDLENALEVLEVSRVDQDGELIKQKSAEIKFLYYAYHKVNHTLARKAGLVGSVAQMRELVAELALLKKRVAATLQEGNDKLVELGLSVASLALDRSSVLSVSRALSEVLRRT